MGKSPVSGEAGTPHHLIKFTGLYGCSLYHPNTIKILTSKITDRDHHAMLCYAKSLQSCQTVCDPIDGSHQGPPSLGFSRQEHWSGVPLPPPDPAHKTDSKAKSRWAATAAAQSKPRSPSNLPPGGAAGPTRLPKGSRRRAASPGCSGAPK